MLRYGLRQNKNGTCYINVMRDVGKIDSNGNRKQNYEQATKIKLPASVSEYPTKLDKSHIQNLSADEITALENWYSSVLFAATELESPVKNLKSDVYHTDEKFLDTINELATAARKHKIEFIPKQVMLEALLDAAKKTEHAIEKKTGKKLGLLSKAGIDSRPSGLIKKLDEKSRMLFKCIYDLPCGTQEALRQFNAIAQRYGRRNNMTSELLRKIAKPKKDEFSPTVKKWMFSIAIDLLHENDINPLSIAETESIAYYFALQRQQEGVNATECVFLFKTRFQPTEEQLVIGTKAIENLYEETATA
ncbi:hypothetical protein [Piscirickettsia salmonis]|uniref:Uncharacterized protein n=1 Tax=Piscirickettsia salmonis TaxID=1238 RepID=A0A9Q6PRN4_PISSA|nr:hypothetical protein [Piscirickettsia salmonis]QGN93957.1 hypothetical protein Psal006a_00528 [Piscirickettsia salmonis]QGO04900.1 hypothetical protein Psal009_00779 [Piscirickettsia salmonis]QGO33221.1 hypothetical protein Psal028_00526 [Piscirickettsia salmonis]QGO36833.1 hypothetical protein Psal040_00526 [Piscirickettsia salmonis]QGO40457.1 hypothetical protein Psal041_00525 [Piscirickettsia salmonis]